MHCGIFDGENDFIHFSPCFDVDVVVVRVELLLCNVSKQENIYDEEL